MASPADYMLNSEDDECDSDQHIIPVDMPCEIVETSAVDQNGRPVLMTPVHRALVKSENNSAMLQMHPGHHHHHHHNHHHQQQQQHHHNNHHQDMEDGQLTYVYESVVPQELYAEPESPGPSR